MSNAPALLQTLKNTVSSKTFDKANDLITNRQFDAPTVGQTIAQNTLLRHPEGNQLISDRLLDDVTNDTVDSLANPTTPLLSQGENDWSIYSLADLMQKGKANNIADTVTNANGTVSKYALNSAAAMLANGLPTDEQIPNPATRMSLIDWDIADMEQMPNTPAKHNLARQLAQRSRANYGVQDFFRDNFRK